MDHSHAFACYNEILMFTFQSITRVLTFLPCTKTLNPVEYTRKWGSAYREFEKQSCHFTLAAWCQMLSQHVQPQQVWKWWLPPTELYNVDTTFNWGNTYYRIHNFNTLAYSDSVATLPRVLDWLKCDWSRLITDDIINSLKLQWA